MYTLSTLKVLSPSFSSLCPSCKSFTSYLCLKTGSCTFMYAACKLWSFCDHSELILSILNVSNDSFSSACPSYSILSNFVCVRNKFMYVWASCIQILVILWPSLYTLSILKFLSHSFRSLCPSRNSFTSYLCLKTSSWTLM